MYEIEPIFVIFPILCLFLSMIERRHKVLCVFVVTVTFFLAYVMSLNGADIINYRIIYRLVSSPETYAEAHGEIGFKWLMLLCQTLNFDYLTFRIVLLTVTTLVLFYSIYKISPNFSLSVFFLTSMFVIYMISAYRQYIVIVFVFFWLYRFSRGNKISAIIGIGVLSFFHISAIVVCVALIVYTLMRNYPYKWCEKLSLLKIFIFIGVAFILRLLFVYAMHFEAVSKFMSTVTNGYSEDDVSIVSFGLLSRLAFLVCITILMCLKKPQDKLTVLLYCFYFVGMICYTIVPFVTFSGRLFNNFHILSAALIPLLCIRKNSNDINFKGSKAKTDYVYLMLAVTVLIAAAVLINQLLNQSGYTPYLNLLFGDELP